MPHLLAMWIFFPLIANYSINIDVYMLSQSISIWTIITPKICAANNRNSNKYTVKRIKLLATNELIIFRCVLLLIQRSSHFAEMTTVNSNNDLKCFVSCSTRRSKMASNVQLYKTSVEYDQWAFSYRHNNLQEFLLDRTNFQSHTNQIWRGPLKLKSAQWRKWMSHVNLHPMTYSFVTSWKVLDTPLCIKTHMLESVNRVMFTQFKN